MKNITSWWWLSYPIFVMLFVFSGLYLMLNQGKLDELVNKGKKIDEQKAEIAVLAERLRVLEGSDQKANSEVLKLALTAVPQVKPVWQAMWAINSSASESGVSVKKYKTIVGDVKEATESGITENDMVIDVEFEVSDFAQTANFVSNLENKLPLVRLISMKYIATNLTARLQVGWQAWSKSLGEDIADNSKVSQQFFEKFTKYGSLNDFQVKDSGLVTIDPF